MSSGVRSPAVMLVLRLPRAARWGRMRACTIMPRVSMPARLGRYAVRRRIGSGASPRSGSPMTSSSTPRLR